MWPASGIFKKCERDGGCRKERGHKGRCLLRHKPTHKAAAALDKRVHQLQAELNGARGDCAKLNGDLGSLTGKLRQAESIMHSVVRSRRGSTSEPLTAEECRTELKGILLADMKADEAQREEELARSTVKLDDSERSAPTESDTRKRNQEAALTMLRLHHEIVSDELTSELLPHVLTAKPLSEVLETAQTADSAAPAAAAVALTGSTAAGEAPTAACADTLQSDKSPLGTASQPFSTQPPPLFQLPAVLQPPLEQQALPPMQQAPLAQPVLPLAQQLVQRLTQQLAAQQQVQQQTQQLLAQMTVMQAVQQLPPFSLPTQERAVQPVLQLPPPLSTRTEQLMPPQIVQQPLPSLTSVQQPLMQLPPTSIAALSQMPVMQPSSSQPLSLLPTLQPSTMQLLPTPQQLAQQRALVPPMTATPEGPPKAAQQLLASTVVPQQPARQPVQQPVQQPVLQPPSRDPVPPLAHMQAPQEPMLHLMKQLQQNLQAMQDHVSHQLQMATISSSHG